MANQQMKDSWAQMKSNIRDIMDVELSDETLEQGRRDLNKLVNVLHQKTGRSRSTIRTELSSLL